MGLCPIPHRVRLMSAQVIQNQMNATFRPVREHHFIEERSARDTFLAGSPTTDCTTGVGTERGEKLQRAQLATVAIGTSCRTLTPVLSSSGDRLYRSQLVKANHRTIGRWVAIQTD